MIPVIVVAAFCVLTLAALVGTGKFGSWSAPVSDRPKGRMPLGPFSEEFMRELVIPHAFNGYAPLEVDEFLSRCLAGEDAGLAADRALPEFGIARGGYDMAFVDELVERVLAQAVAPETQENSKEPEASLPEAPVEHVEEEVDSLSVEEA